MLNQLRSYIEKFPLHLNKSFRKVLVAFVLPLKNVFLSDLFLGKRRWKKKKKNYSGQDM